jgi:hypothetical protein
MTDMTIDQALDVPIVVFVASLAVQCLATYAGYLLRPRGRPIEETRVSDLDIVHGAALTLLALVIGFTFTMAVTRYDQRKNYEEDEANHIGTEYARISLLPINDTNAVKSLMKDYTFRRIQFYQNRDSSKLDNIEETTEVLQKKLWASVSGPASAKPTPVNALAVSGMNDVIDSAGFTNAAWRNRVPSAAWIFLEVIALICNMLLGYRFKERSIVILFLFPLITSLSFFVISDIDNPRQGIIQVIPQNLILEAKAMKAQ